MATGAFCTEEFFSPPFERLILRDPGLRTMPTNPRNTLPSAAYIVVAPLLDIHKYTNEPAPG
jgi:hypothetical protein